jgi:RNA polymerase sigma-70 factor (ECF subfamily)
MSKPDSPALADPSGAVPLDPRTWLDRHGDYLYHFALARVRRPDVAEDLIQESLLSAWKGRSGYDGSASERTWLTAILKRKAIDWLRRQVRERLVQQSTESEPLEADLFTRRGEWREAPVCWKRSRAADSIDREEFWTILHGCLDKLPVRLHDVFALRYLDEAAADEVCRELGLTPANLWVMLHRARLRMWCCLSRNWFGEEPEGSAL